MHVVVLQYMAGDCDNWQHIPQTTGSPTDGLPGRLVGHADLYSCTAHSANGFALHP